VSTVSNGHLPVFVPVHVATSRELSTSNCSFRYRTPTEFVGKSGRPDAMHLEEGGLARSKSQIVTDQYKMTVGSTLVLRGHGGHLNHHQFSNLEISFFES
jgi:hypothetical protein